jgi:hypothetical protein
VHFLAGTSIDRDCTQRSIFQFNQSEGLQDHLSGRLFGNRCTRDCISDSLRILGRTWHCETRLPAGVPVRPAMKDVGSILSDCLL